MTVARDLKSMDYLETREPTIIPTRLGIGTWMALVPIPTLLSSRCFHEGQGSKEPNP